MITRCTFLTDRWYGDVFFYIFNNPILNGIERMPLFFYFYFFLNLLRLSGRSLTGFCSFYCAVLFRTKPLESAESRSETASAERVP